MDGLPRTGERLSHYRITDRLGAGGMGEVYRAHDEQLHRDVAIKLLPPDSIDDPGARARLVREARAAASLNHPYICTVHEVGETDGQAYIAMELVEGETLSDRLASGPMAVDQAVRCGAQLAEALGHAHERGVLHRDLKSANVIVTPAGRVKVLDFGLAKRLNASELTTQLDATATGGGTVAGTLPYMAPEQLRGQTAQAAADVWALGVVLYEMTHGKRPFQGQTSFEVSAAILGAAPAPFAPSIPAGLQAVIARCLEKEPGLRYKTGNEVCAALEILQTQGGGADITDARIAPALPVRRVRKPWRTWRPALAAGAIAVVLALAAAVTAWVLWPMNAPAPVRSIAVLPFRNIQNDATLDHLCDGITEGLVRRIKTITSLRVVALRRVLHYKGYGVDPRDVGRDLNVENVLSGTVTRQASKLKIDVALIETVKGTPLWSDTYTLDASALLDTQDDILSAIMDKGLRVSLSAAERQRLVTHPTSDAQAYDLFLQAGYLQRRGTEDEYLQAKDLLERAIKRDGKFSLAYAALSALYAMLVVDGYMRPTEAWSLVDKYLRQAVALDPALLVDAAGYEHAQAFFFFWNWEAAASARKKVLETKSKHFDMEDLRALAIERWALGHADEALELVRRTRLVDPLNPDMMSVEADYLRQTGQLDAAATRYRESINLDAANHVPYFGLAELFAEQRRFDEANDYRRQAHAVAGDEAMAEAFAQAKGEAGYRQADRRWVLQQLKSYKDRAARNAYVSPLDLARAYAMLDDPEQAFRYLKDALDEHSSGMVFLNVDRAWDSVRHDPRFLYYVRKVGLPEPAAPRGKSAVEAR